MSPALLALVAVGLVVVVLAIYGARNRRRRRLAIELEAKNAARAGFASILVEEAHRAIADPALSPRDGAAVVVDTVGHLIRLNDDGGLDAFIAEHEEALARALAEHDARRRAEGRG